VRLWDVAKGQRIAENKELHASAITSTRFSPGVCVASSPLVLGSTADAGTAHRARAGRGHAVLYHPHCFAGQLAGRRGRQLARAGHAAQGVSVRSMA
jgi:hypothetical protein